MVVKMTNKQQQEIQDFMVQIEERSMDSLDFAQMTFTVEDIVSDTNGAENPTLSHLAALLKEQYPIEFEEWFNELNGAAKNVLNNNSLLAGTT